jgi:superfamily II DNA helicase RecQ
LSTTSPSADGRDIARSIAADPLFQVEVAQIRARATLTELLGEAPPYRWTYIAPRVVRNAAAALFDLERLALSDPAALPAYTNEALQYAYVWESLAMLEEATTRDAALLNAAAAYDLAGYQANAVCIARSLIPVPPLPPDVPASTRGLAALFLRRLFLLTAVNARVVVAEPDVEELSFEELYAAAGHALVGQGVAEAARAFLGGEERHLGRAAESLDAAERSFVEVGQAADANLARLLRALIPVMWSRSTWQNLGALHGDSPIWQRYLKLLARGLGRHLLLSSSVSELWPSQVTALNGGLLDSGASKVIRMPTSAGKTRVAELAIVEVLARRSGAKCVYVAPFKALVSEVEQTFAALLSDLGFRVSSIIGTYESDDFEQLLAEDADLIVVTPEKLDLLLRLRADFLSRVELIVLDEGHLVHDLTRGAKYELLLTRIKIALPTARFVLLSAVVPDQTLVDFARWLNRSEEGIITSSWRPSVQRIAALDWGKTTGVLRYLATDDASSTLQAFVPGIVQQRTYAFENPQTGRVNRRRFPEDGAKGQIAAELAYEFADIGSVLIFCTIPTFAVSAGKALARRLELAALVDEVIPPYFSTPDTRSARVAAEWLGEDHEVTHLLQRGIAVHHGQLPDAVRNAVEVDFRERRYRVICATNTLAQGVNLPIRTVIMHSCWRGDENGQHRILAREYWNIAGRAGRAREETEGTIVHLVVSAQDARDYRYFVNARDDVEPVESALFQALKAIAEARFTEAALAEALDAEVLAMVVEEATRAEVGDFLDQVVAESLVAVQAADRGFDVDPVTRALGEARAQIARVVSNSNFLPVYSATGLRSDSCERLRMHVVDNADVVEQLLQANEADFQALADLMLDACAPLDEMQPDAPFDGDHRELLSAWLDGSTVGAIRDALGDEAPAVEALTKFIEDLFAYRLPWGFASYLRIAEHALGLEREAVGPGPRFFPSMVKFGVPFPEAAWAMAAGVPVRRVGIALGEAFVGGESGGTYADFFEWIGRVDTETLRRVYGLAGPVLDDVARALRRAGRNPLLADGKPLDELLPLDTHVRGIAFDNRRVVALRAEVGNEVELVRDYANVIDENAVLVLLGSQQLGYLPRQVAQLLAPEIDAGLELGATVTEIEDEDGVPSVAVVIATGP